MFRFGPARILHFDSGIYCEGRGEAHSEVGRLEVDGQEYPARASLHITTPVEALQTVRDPYAETRVALKANVHLTIVPEDDSFRFEGDAEAGEGGFMVMRANELAALEWRRAFRLLGNGAKHARRVHGNMVGRIVGWDPAGYPEFEIAFDGQDGASDE